MSKYTVLGNCLYFIANDKICYLVINNKDEIKYGNISFYCGLHSLFMCHVCINILFCTYLVGGAVRRCRPLCSSREGCSRCSPFVLLRGLFKVRPQGPDRTSRPQNQHRAKNKNRLLTWFFATLKFPEYTNLNRPRKKANRDIQKCLQKS